MAGALQGGVRGRAPRVRESLERYYRQGPAADWPARYITAYSSSHPFEDWAESWAHYLHMVDTVETAAAIGCSLRPRRDDEPSLEKLPPFVVSKQLPFERLIEAWFASAIEKLRFVHDLIGGLPPAAPCQDVPLHEGRQEVTTTGQDAQSDQNVASPLNGEAVPP